MNDVPGLLFFTLVLLNIPFQEIIPKKLILSERGDQNMETLVLVPFERGQPSIVYIRSQKSFTSLARYTLKVCKSFTFHPYSFYTYIRLWSTYIVFFIRVFTIQCELLFCDNRNFPLKQRLPNRTQGNTDCCISLQFTQTSNSFHTSHGLMEKVFSSIAIYTSINLSVMNRAIKIDANFTRMK